MSFVKELNGEVDVIVHRVFAEPRVGVSFHSINSVWFRKFRNIALEFGFGNAVCSCRDSIWVETDLPFTYMRWTLNLKG